MFFSIKSFSLGSAVLLFRGWIERNLAREEKSKERVPLRDARESKGKPIGMGRRGVGDKGSVQHMRLIGSRSSSWGGDDQAPVVVEIFLLKEEEKFVGWRRRAGVQDRKVVGF